MYRRLPLVRLSVLLAAFSVVGSLGAADTFAKPGGLHGNPHQTPAPGPTPTASPTATPTPRPTATPSPTAPSPTPTAGSGSVQWQPGVDVSHWKGTINWALVAAAGKQFAIAKATQGQTYDDPTYATNRLGASSAGLRFGAFHFAAPSATLGDALTQADHFVAFARPRTGDLIPALDLESTGGLGVTALQTWVRTWLDEVTRLTNVKPMIYTSPSFWGSYMGNTMSFATGGYKILWIAHWYVTSPTVPAQNWGGNGWTFWQYTNSGTVPGITGGVDLDWYKFADFSKVTIP